MSNITSLTDLKFVTADFAGKGISVLSDRPNDDGLTAAQLKAAFDELVEDVVSTRVNQILDVLAASGGSLLGTAAVPGVAGETVADQIASLYSQLIDITQGSVANGSITDEKLSTASVDLLARFAGHDGDTEKHLTYLGVTQGTASEYTTADEMVTGIYLMKAHITNAQGATLNGKSIIPSGFSVLEAGQIKQDGVYLVYFDGSLVHLLNPETHSHTHATGEITGLSSSLGGKADAVHSHTISQVTNLQSTISTMNSSISSKQPKITYGTGNPSGGSSGDVYIKY